MTISRKNNKGTNPFEWPVYDSGPFGGPSRISLPSSFGILPEFQKEWWYIVGDITDKSNNKYSLFIVVVKLSIGSPDFSLIGTNISVGSKTTGNYYSNLSGGFGASNDDPTNSLYLPNPTNKSFSLNYNGTILGKQNVSLHYTGGNALGLLGAEYVLDAYDEKHDMKILINVKDDRGTVLEGTNGAVTVTTGKIVDSYEWACPRWRVTSGTMVLKEKTSPITITSGNLWFDRQFVQHPPGFDKMAITDFLKTPKFDFPKLASKYFSGHAINVSGDHLKPLYVGSWTAIFLESGINLVTASFWPPSTKPGTIWISGTKVNRPALEASFGTIYYPIHPGTMIAISPLNHKNFSLNILNPSDPPKSPHYKSPETNNTYTTAWELTITKEHLPQSVPITMYMFALLDKTEISFFGNGFWEGSVEIYTDKDRKNKIGNGFIEQMGFN